MIVDIHHIGSIDLNHVRMVGPLVTTKNLSGDDVVQFDFYIEGMPGRYLQSMNGPADTCYTASAVVAARMTIIDVWKVSQS